MAVSTLFETNGRTGKHVMEPFTGKASEWNSIISGLPNAHLLQTWEWAEVKTSHGWKAIPVLWKKKNGKSEDVLAAAMILKRTVLNRGHSARLCILYIPKGPILDWTNKNLINQVLDDLQVFAKKQGSIFLKIDPDVVIGRGIPTDQMANENNEAKEILSELNRRSWLFSSDQIQFRNTVLIDVTGKTDQMLARMKQKTRYNVRLAEKKGVVLRVGNADDLPLLYRMYAETSVRDGFVIRNEDYYRLVWKTFINQASERIQPTAEPLIAEVNGEPVAAIIIFYFGDRAIYLYGMSFESNREKMPNYLLQWEAMKRANARGCSVYDLWGAPDEFDESNSMWGVFRFKEGLGGEIVRTIGAWDYPASPFWYRIYTKIIPRILNIMRAFGRTRTQNDLE